MSKEKALKIYESPDENVPPLNTHEEKVYEKNKKDKAQEEIDVLFARVKNIKSVIENPEFYDIFIKPIKESIVSIKDALETEEKTRDIVLKQGALGAFRKMLNFPETAVAAFNSKVTSIEDTMPLFVSENEFIRNVSVSFDQKEYQIIIRGIE